jgi:ABC-type polysaccharide/polyol phosphate export permease
VGVPYPIFVYCGLLPWQWFSGALKNAAESLARNNRLVAKIYMPREVFPLSCVLSACADFAAASTLLGALMVWHRVPVALAGLLWLPAVVAAQFLLVAGLALLLAMANLFFRDVKYVLEALLLVGMFATSVVYPLRAESLGGWAQVLALNPMTHLIDAYRQTLLHGQPPSLLGFGYAATVAVAVFLYGLKKFHECEFLFAERV